jgi:hypothetical protein
MTTYDSHSRAYCIMISTENGTIACDLCSPFLSYLIGACPIQKILGYRKVDKMSVDHMPGTESIDQLEVRLAIIATAIQQSLQRKVDVPILV